MPEIVDDYNVILRVVDDDQWPFGPSEAEAPLAVVSVDLLDNDDATGRARTAGMNILRGLGMTGHAAN